MRDSLRTAATEKGFICGGLSNCEGSCSCQKTGPGSHKAERDRDAVQSRNLDRKRISVAAVSKPPCTEGTGGDVGEDCKSSPAQGL